MRAARTAALAAAMALLAAGAQAQNSTADGIAQYRALLADGNPADLWEAKGEALWKNKRGPKNASLEACDLGKGPGVVKGAFVELPRYFADTQRVQDLESRLLSCMEMQQGFKAAEIAATPFGRGEQANMAKLLAADAGYAAADAAMQTHGGMGYAKEYDVERYWREARLMRIAPVSQEMVLNYITGKVLGLPRSY